MNPETQARLHDIFNHIVNDIMFVWDNVPREIAEKSALTFIQNADMKAELEMLVRAKQAESNA